METNPIFHSRYPLGKDYPGFKKPALPTKLGGRDSRKPSNSVAQLQQRLHTLAGQIPIAKNMSAGKLHILPPMRLMETNQFKTSIFATFNNKSIY
ncbi:hypothetical protein RTP6_007684 [Batrachochytrium dendrobatidis]